MALPHLARICSAIAMLFYLSHSWAAPSDQLNEIALSQYVHEEWQTDRGLPQNSVSCLAQDQSGFLWLGTENGLVRFDGIQFETFNEAATPLKDSYVAKILVAKDGKVWGALRDGGVFSFQNESFRFYTTSNGLSNNQVWTLAETTDGAIWAGTRNGLNRIQNGSITKFTTHEGLPHPHITALKAGRDGDLWIGTGQGALSCFHAGTLTNIAGTTSQQRSELKALEFDKRTGKVWIGHDGEGLFVFENGEIKPVTELQEKGILNIQSLYLQDDGALWIGTQYNGVLRLKQGQFSSYSRKDGLSSDYVASILVDNDQSVWLGTAYGGLNRLRRGRIVTFSELEGMPEENISCVIPDSAGGLFIGSMRGGVYNFSKTNSYSKVPLELGTHNIRGLALSKSGALWVASGGGGLAIVEPSGIHYHSTKTGLPQNDVTAIYEDRSENMWVGTQSHGVAVWRKNSTSWELYTNSPVLLNYIRCFAEDDSGTLWIGTQRGLAKMSEGQVMPVNIPGASELSVRSLLPEPGVLWITTRDEGIIRLAGAESHIFEFGTHRPIYHLLRVGEEFWFSSNRGIERVLFSEIEQSLSGHRMLLDSDLYNERDGMRTSECNGGFTPSACQTPDGRIWFATKRGVSMVDPSRKPKQKVQNVVFRSIIMDGKRLSPEHLSQLPRGQTRLEFQYTTPSLAEPQKVKFKYKLEELDKDYIVTSYRREAVYYNIPPGSYTFRVMASDAQGAWGSPPATLSFVIPRAFYQQPWFYFVGVAFLALSTRATHRWRVRRIAKHAEELQAEVEKRTTEIQNEVKQRTQAEQNLVRLNNELEQRVASRTVELRQAMENLQQELQDRKRAEEALAASESKLRRVVDSGMVGIFFWEQNGLVTKANNTFLQMIGYTNEELSQTHLHWNQLTPEKYLPADASALHQISKTGVCSPFEKEYIRRDGTRVPVLVGGASFKGTPGAGVCFVLDISERKQAVEEIRSLNVHLEARVQQRTSELEQSKQKLELEIQERNRVAVALASLSHLGQKLHSAHTEKEAARIIAETAQSLIAHDACIIELYGKNNLLYPVLELPFGRSPSNSEHSASTISVSIRNGTRAVGVLSLRGSATSGFNSADTSTLQALGDYCGGALERIHAEEARRELERRFSAFMGHAPALAWMKDSSFKYVYTNAMFQDFLGCGEFEIKGKTDFDLWPEDIATRLREHDLRALQNGAPLETHDYIRQVDSQHRILLALRFIFMTGTGEQLIAGMAVDITEQKRAEEALHKLPQKIIQAQEGERRRVARELHDGVNQALASIKFRIQTAEQQILRGDAKWQESCSRSKEMLDSVLQQVRRLSRNLRPGELDDFGLVPAIRSACQDFQERTGLDLDLNTSPIETRLPPALELSLYRILQEALTNIEKHSKASRVSVKFLRDDSYVTLQIEDDGQGLQITEPKRRNGLGLLHMRERANLVGGVFSIKASDGKGVSLTVHAPLKELIEIENE
jgi:PAS domain S-box-containing protein